MRSSSILAPLAFAASTLAQAVPEGIAPSSSPPSGCETTANGNFTIGTLKLAHTKRETASEAADGALVCNLNKGVLRDSYGRTGSVVANRQFQFDGPPQAGAIYTGGFSICKNGSLAIGGTTRWFQCASGGFHNLYDQSIGGQCEEIRIQVQLLNQPSASPSAASSATSPVASVASSLATISGQISTVSASAVGPTASLSRSGNATATSAPSSGASGSAGASTSRGLTPGSSGAAGASSAAPAPPAGGAASASFSAAGSSMLGLAMAVIGGAAFIL